MAVSRCSPSNGYCRITSARMLAICLYLIIVGVNHAKGTTAVGLATINEATTIPKVTKATLVPLTRTAHTVGPPPPLTVGPPPPLTVAPPPPSGCGSQQNYDITDLTTPPYWTLTQLGACFDSFGDPNIVCEFSFAFCKQLPGKPGIGASQVSTISGAPPLRLGERSIIVQNTDEKATQLLVSFQKGNSTTCGQIQVELHLHCNKDAVWPTPVTGQAGTFPTATIVALDKQNCKYIIETDYSGSCIPLSPTGLSAGSILIIIFICFVAAYLVGGLFYNLMSGARGMELIPNYEMWTMFPSDVIGGVLFVFGLISCQKCSKSGAYDDI